MAVIRRSSPLPTPRSFEELRAQFSQPLASDWDVGVNPSENWPTGIRAALSGSLMTGGLVPSFPMGDAMEPAITAPPGQPTYIEPFRPPSEEQMAAMDLPERIGSQVLGAAIDLPVFAGLGIATAPLGGVGSAATTFGVYNALQAAKRQRPVEEIATEAGKGVVLGLVTGGAGKLIDRRVANSAFQNAIKAGLPEEAAKEAAKAAAEGTPAAIGKWIATWGGVFGGLAPSIEAGQPTMPTIEGIFGSLATGAAFHAPQIARRLPEMAGRAAAAAKGPTVFFHGTQAAGIEVPDIRNGRPVFVTTSRDVAQQAATQGAAGARMGEVKGYGRGRVLPLEIASGTRIIDETPDIARQIRMIEDSAQVEPDQARLLWMQQNNIAVMRTGSAVRSAEDIRQGIPEQFKLSEHEYAIADPNVLRRSMPGRLPLPKMIERAAPAVRRLLAEERGSIGRRPQPGDPDYLPPEDVEAQAPGEGQTRRQMFEGLRTERPIEEMEPPSDVLAAEQRRGQREYARPTEREDALGRANIEAQQRLTSAEMQLEAEREFQDHPLVDPSGQIHIAEWRYQRHNNLCVS